MKAIAITTPALRLAERRTWLLAAAFVAGNLLFPQLCHLIPDGGKMLLPIMLFTLVSAARFGLQTGLLTAIASPLLSVAIFGSPSDTILTAVVIKSLIIAITFGLWRQYKGTFTLWNVVLLTLACQLICFPIEGVLLFGMARSWHELLISWPGMLLQVVAAMAALKYWK